MLEVGLTDFGCSKQAIEDVTLLHTFRIGTLEYQAPEVLYRSSDSYNFAVDIWALGLVVYTMLTAKSLFRDQAVLQKYLDDPSAIINTMTNAFNEKNLSHEDLAFFMRMIATDPGVRPSAEECVNEWRHLWVANGPFSPFGAQ